MAPRVCLTRTWRLPKALIGLFVLEFALTIAALALYGIAAPNLYRTRLWQDGADNGFNSDPNEVLYAAANYRSIKTPLCWSQFITSYNVVISVLSMFILLTKSVMFVMNIFFPLLSVLVHAILVALYAVSTHAQISSDMTDPRHPQPGAPWYITKSCSVVHDASNYNYCRQAKASFGVTIAMLGLFALYILLSLLSLVLRTTSEPTKSAHNSPSIFGSKLHKRKPAYYTPEPPQPGHNAMQAWSEKLSRDYVALCTPGTTGGIKSPPVGARFDDVPLATPRTVAFQTLDGAGRGKQVRKGSAGSGSRGLPFRETYGGVDGR